MDLCPRGDLNPHAGEISLNLDLNSKTGEKSPEWGVHAAMVASTLRSVSSGPGRLAANSTVSPSCEWHLAARLS